MSKKFLSIIWLSVLLMVALPGYSQIDYSCDFENPAEVANWNLNAGTKAVAICANQWRVGPAGNFGTQGNNGLYISPRSPQDSQDTTWANYVTSSSMMVMAYRDLTLSVGTHTLVFDYKCQGGTDAYAVVCWIPQTQSISSHNSNNNLPNWAKTPIAKIYNHGEWQSISETFQVTAANQQGRLVIVWTNGTGYPSNPSACIDNLQIYEGTPCAATPQNVRYTGGRVTWNRVTGATAYEVCIYNTFDGTFLTQQVVNTTSWTPALTGSGYMFLYVRAICANGTHSSWASVASFVYDNSDMCIDYLDLDRAKCYVGPFDDVTTGQIGKVDHGYASNRSHHTVHYMQGELDPNTQNMLTTIPAGRLASVRLGNDVADDSYSGQGRAEAIEYTYTVKAGASDILNIEYAVIMEKPGHNDGTDPHFTLEILDGRKQQIGGFKKSCYSADFAAASNRPQDLVGWHEWNNGGYSPIIWKDWTTISVSLHDYVGQTLTIRFTTKDCRQSAHWAYAYFTLSCSSGSLEGVSCGDYSTDHFTAPDGFNYRWYVQDDPLKATISTDQTLHISPTSDTIYCVEVSQMFGNNCGYTLVANPNPKFPRSIIKEIFVGPRDCQNIAEIENLSKVFIINRLTKDTMPNTDNDKLDYVLWNWGDGTPEEEVTDDHVSHVYPKTGGTFTILAIASMNGGVCVDTARYVVRFPDLENTGSSLTDKYVHVGDSYTAPSGKVYQSDIERVFIDTNYVKNQYNCDAPQVTRIHFVDAVIIRTDSIICYGDSVYHDGSYFSTTGEHAVTHHIMPQDYDSINLLSLYVVPEMKVTTKDTLATCGRAEKLPIPLYFEQGKRQFNGADVLVHLVSPTGAAFDSLYSLAYDGEGDTIYLPLPQYVQPDFYTMELGWITKSDTLNAAPCAVPPMTATLQVCYDSVVLDQKEGFVALLNERYNYGSWTYDSVEWYRDNELLPGENGYYIHVDTADLGHAFSVRLTRPHEVVKVPSCPIIYTGVRSVPIAPNGPAPARVAPRVVATEDGKFYLIIENNDGKQIYVY